MSKGLNNILSKVLKYDCKTSAIYKQIMEPHKRLPAVSYNSKIQDIIYIESETKHTKLEKLFWLLFNVGIDHNKY